MPKVVFYSRKNPPKSYESKQYSTIYQDIEFKKDVKVIDKDNDVYEIVDKEVVVNAYDTDKLTKSFAGQTGLEAVMKRVAITGDVSLLGSSLTSDETPIVDATKVPNSIGEVKALADKVDSLVGSIPVELLKGRSVEDFLRDITAEQVKEYVDSFIKKQIDSTKTKEGGVE